MLPPLAIGIGPLQCDQFKFYLNLLLCFVGFVRELVTLGKSFKGYSSFYGAWLHKDLIPFRICNHLRVKKVKFCIVNGLKDIIWNACHPIKKGLIFP